MPPTNTEQPKQESPYEMLGGGEKLHELVDRFYDYMDTLFETQSIRDMHAKSLKVSREKLFMFLSGWLGGPDLYIEKYGHPMLRRRHMPFSIGKNESQQWLLCMEKAMDDMSIEHDLRIILDRSFKQTAEHMHNIQ
ncbi:MAG: group II truncated hemoglobin [Gammaproteobacteria bacterium]|nr:group II truncated hemoglobin [Gammaproteobacteria bacterium]